MQEEDNLQQHEDAGSEPGEVMHSPPIEDSTPDSGEETAADQDTGDVMDILADVERQFDRLREVQHAHADEMAAQADRSAQIAVAQEELRAQQQRAQEQQDQIEQARYEIDESRQAMQAEQEALSAAQAALEEDRRGLSDQRAALEEQQQADAAALAAQRQEIDGQQEGLQAQRQELDQRLVEWEEQRQQLQAQHEQKQAEHERLQAEHEQQRAEHEQLQAEHDQQRQVLEQRDAELADHSRRLVELSEQEQGLRDRVTELGRELGQTREHAEKTETEAMELLQEADLQQRSLKSQVEQLQAECAEAGRRVEEAHQQGNLIGTKHDLAQEQLQRVRSELEAKDQQLERRREQVERLTEQLGEVNKQVREQDDAAAAHAAELEELNGRTDEQRQALAEGEQRLKQAEQDLEAARKHGEGLQNQVSENEAMLQQREADLEQHLEESQRIRQQLTDSRQKLELAGTKLSKFAKLLGEQAPQLEQGAGAMALVEQQHRQIESLTRQLAEAKRGSDVEGMKRKDQRVKELTDALRQARGQVVANVDTAEIEKRKAELESENDRLRLQLEEVQLAAEETRRQMEQHVQGERIEQQAEHNATVQFEIEREQLQQRIGQLEQELHDAADARETMAAESRKHQTHSRKINEAARHLRRRQERLRRMHRVLRGRNRDQAASFDTATVAVQSALAARADGGEVSTGKLAEVGDQRREMEQLREVMAAAERKMVRRWARPRAVFTICWFFVLMAVNGGMAWLAADHFFPPERVATVTLRPDAGAGALFPEQLQAWARWHEQMLYEEEFQQALGERVASRQVSRKQSAGDVVAMLERQLTVDASQPDELTVSLSGVDTSQMVYLLDLMTSTVVAQSRRRAETRREHVSVEVLGARAEGNQVRYAALRRLPLSDERLRYAGPIFGVSFLVTLVLIVSVYSRLVRAKRVFEEGADPLAPVED